MINIEIKNKRPTVIGSPVIICGNSDYKINFTFDAEWDEYDIKTVRFSYRRNGESFYEEKVITGSECEVPVFYGIFEVLVGVYAGDIHTTTSATIVCEKSIKCSDAIHEEPPEDVYNQIVELCSDAVNTAKNIETKANNGEFDGKDYVLTEDDKKEIADLSGDNVGAKTEQGGEIFNDYENNQAMSEYSSAKGKNTRTGAHGYKIKYFDTLSYNPSNNNANISVWLIDIEGKSATDLLEVNDIVNLELDYHHYGLFKISEIYPKSPENDGMAILIIRPIRTITAEDGRVINLHVPTIDELNLKSNNDNWLWCAEKRTAGELIPFIASNVSGVDSVSIGDGAVAMGVECKSLGQYSFSGGAENEANYSAFAINRNNHALGEYSVASGNNSYATKRFSSANGDRCIAEGESAVAHGAACRASGNGAVAQGRGCIATGDYAFASGLSNEATVQGAIALGVENKASYYRDVAIGANNTANGAGSVALGSENKVSSNNGVALGYNNNVIGPRSIAIGVGNKPNSADCVAIGNGNTCQSGHYALASGLNCITKYDYTVALGEQCLSQGRASVAAGVKNEAYGSGSVALGLKTIAKGYGQTVVGYYNEAIGSGHNTNKNAEDTAIFIAGNGTSDANRHNAFVIYDDNSIKIGDTKITESQLKKLLALIG